MIIGIDASKLLSSQRTGVEVATTDLVKAILKNDEQNTYWLYSAAPISQDLPWGERIKNVVVPGKRFWTQRYLSQELRKSQPDIFWSPSYILPNHLPKRSVATIHDLAFYLFPESYSWRERWLSTWAVRKAARYASKLVAVSQQTKKDLKRYFNVPGEDIEVVYHALRSDFILEEFDLATIYPQLAKYFLYVGRIELRKNILNILKAFAKFGQNHPEAQLVLAGSRGYGYGKIKTMVKKLHLTDRAILLDYVAADRLPMLYAKSLGVVLVSQYEGFGFPILEGWASDVPVLTSNIGATAEIAGNAALLVNPRDISAISQGFTDLFTQPELCQRLVAKGRQQLLKFSWDKSAQKMIELWTKL